MGLMELFETLSVFGKVLLLVLCIIYIFCVISFTLTIVKAEEGEGMVVILSLVGIAALSIIFALTLAAVSSNTEISPTNESATEPSKISSSNLVQLEKGNR